MTTETPSPENRRNRAIVYLSALAPALHKAFVDLVEGDPGLLSWSKQAVNNSRPFVDAAKEVATMAFGGETDMLSPAEVKQVIDGLQIAPHKYIFTGAVCALWAAILLDKGDAARARAMAAAALSYSQFDLYAQEIALRADHLLTPSTPSYEEMEAWLKTRFCPVPFTTVETTTANEFYRCCPSYLPAPVGTMDVGSIDEVLNSPVSKNIRSSIVDGSFRYCSKMYCPAIGNRALMSREEGLEMLKTLSDYPEIVTFSHDPSCNLSCPSCRKERIVVPKQEQDKFDSLSERLLIPLMEKAKTISICGSGDPFASMHFRNLLIAYCRKAEPGTHRLSLQTNGILLDARAWESIGLEGHVREILLSMDAAHAETYAVVRRGGNFARLMENLLFLRDMRRQGRYKELVLRFVVQARNFREMADFIRLGKEAEADQIFFSQIRNWGTFPPELFAQQNVTDPAHPEHGELLRLLEDPIFEEPIVMLNDLAKLRSGGDKSQG